jgi:SAM-dependent methyltransferase
MAHRGRRPEDWEFAWQRDNWVALFRKPETQRQVLEYWTTFRHLEEIRALVPITEASRILDVGCGISTLLHYLPGERHGIDPLADRYQTIYDYPPGMAIRAGYGEAIPFEDGWFDVVVCSNAIDHTRDPQRTISEIYRVLKPHGHLILTCEVFEEDLGPRNPGHPHSITLPRLSSLVERFDVIAHWDSPWIGLYRYVTGNLTSERREHIMLLKRPP